MDNIIGIRIQKQYHHNSIKEEMKKVEIEYISDIGKIFWCMEKGNLVGKEAKNIQVIILKIWNKDMVNFNGVMAEFIKDNGKQEKCMVLENIQIVLEK